MPFATQPAAAPVIARCTKCLRGYVWLPPGKDTCSYPPAIGYPVCGGKIEMFPTPIPNATEPPIRLPE